jgi:hypothetical protein
MTQEDEWRCGLMKQEIVKTRHLILPIQKLSSEFAELWQS